MLILSVAYLSLALTFTLCTRAYEADDEQAHTDYVEYIVRNGALPQISAANLQESHQPPLYYLLVAGWQKVLGIPAFTPTVVQEHYANPFLPDRLLLVHNYTPQEHREAVSLHELRLLSVLFGLGTVLLTYASARVVKADEPVALAAGLFVALLPRELVVTSAVTNDALVIPLCALALMLFLLAERARHDAHPRNRSLSLLGMGLALGAAALTKFNSLPLAAVLVVLSLAPAFRRSPGAGLRLRTLVDTGICALGFLAVSGWWFLRNERLYGQFLATKSSEAYLRVYGLHPVSWSHDLFFRAFPDSFFNSTWYTQPNLYLSIWAYRVLGAFGFASLVVGVYVFAARRQWVASGLTRLSSWAYMGCVGSGIVAVLITVKTTSIGDARIAFIGLSAFALVAVVSLWRLCLLAGPRLGAVGLMSWPIGLLAVDLFVVARFLVPLGGL